MAADLVDLLPNFVFGAFSPVKGAKAPHLGRSGDRQGLPRRLVALIDTTFAVFAPSR
jgi:hypothetical protein